MEALIKKMWTVLGSFSQKTKKHEKHEPAEEEAKEVVKEDPQRRIFRLYREQRLAAEKAAKDEEWQKEKAALQAEEENNGDLNSKEISCARELLRADYVPLSAILCNGGIPQGYVLVQRQRRTFSISQFRGTMEIDEVGTDEESWLERIDYRLIPQNLSAVLSKLTGLSADQLKEMPEIVQSIFYFELEDKVQLRVEGPVYRQEIEKTRCKYRVISKHDIDRALTVGLSLIDNKKEDGFAGDRSLSAQQ